ncbi:MAG TPA: hypothetical protein VJT73_04300 [Polyangiaceae bacterium]|nr:hypothetical protein [Polyangiaceae bacterium]
MPQSPGHVSHRSSVEHCLSPHTTGQSVRQLSACSPRVAEQTPSPQRGGQSAGQFAIVSSGLQCASPQRGGQSPAQLPEFSPAVQRPSPQRGGQSLGQVAAFSLAVEQKPSLQRAGQSEGQDTTFSLPLQNPSLHRAGQSCAQLCQVSPLLQVESPHLGAGHPVMQSDAQVAHVSPVLQTKSPQHGDGQGLVRPQPSGHMMSAETTDETGSDRVSVVHAAINAATTSNPILMAERPIAKARLCACSML